MTKRSLVLLAFLALIPGEVPAQNPEPIRDPAVQEPAEELKEFPKELSKGGTRLFNIEFEPATGAVIPSNGSLLIKFAYETDSPGKVFVGAMPFTSKSPSGGYQPALLSAPKGTAEVRIFCGAPPPTKPITTMDELRASYVALDGMELQIYGKEQRKIQAPVQFSVIPAASFTVQEKYYLDRLLQEVIALRKRVSELEQKQLASSGTKSPK